MFFTLASHVALTVMPEREEKVHARSAASQACALARTLASSLLFRLVRFAVVTRACLDLHDYKRAYPNAGTSLLETAIDQCTRIKPAPKRRRFDRPQAGARRIAWTSDEENDE